MNKLLLIVLLGSAAMALAQVKVVTEGARVEVGNGINVNANAKDVSTVSTEGNTSSVTIGGIEGGGNVQGVSVINGKVWVDGDEVPPNATRFKSRKTGTVYKITRKGTNVSVTSE